jgi:hypothetical protein
MSVRYVPTISFLLQGKWFTRFLNLDHLAVSKIISLIVPNLYLIHPTAVHGYSYFSHHPKMDVGQPRNNSRPATCWKRRYLPGNYEGYDVQDCTRQH